MASSAKRGTVTRSLSQECPGFQRSRNMEFARYCFNRKNKLPVGGVMVMLFVPLAVVMV